MNGFLRGEIVRADAIQVRDRARRDLGDLASLVESIRNVGLLNPPVVRMDGDAVVLVAGHRRLEALRLLGWVDIPVSVALTAEDTLLALRMERDENTERLDLRPSEAVAEGRRIEALERVAAKERQAANARATTAKRQGDEGAESAPSSVGKTRARVAEAVGMKPTRYAAAAKVVAAAEDPDSPEPVREAAVRAVEDMDATGNVAAALRAVEAAKAAAVAEYVEADPEYRMAVLRRDLFKTVRQWRPPVDMDPVEAAGLDLGSDLLTAIDTNQKALNDWIDRFRQARPSGLRVISGGSR